MKLEHRSQVESLARFRSERHLTTSLYFDWDKSRLNKKEISLSLKSLLHAGRQKIEALGLSKPQRESLEGDLELFQAHGLRQLPGANFPGLALFSCRAEKFWREFNLGSPPRNRLVFDQNPFVKPLSAALEESRSIGLLLLDRRDARWFSIHMGEAKVLDSLHSDVPSKVKPGGFEGYESKRIERHVEAHLQDHFKRAAQTTFDLFKSHSFDVLFLGCAEEHRSEVESLLHPYVKGRLRGSLRLKPDSGQDQVLREVNELEKKLKKEEDEGLLLKFVSELEKGGLAVSGLRDTLRSLNAGEALTLLLERDLSTAGRFCPSCRFLYLDESSCPACRKPTRPVLDVVDEAVELAMDKKTGVRHINPPSKLGHYGKIGALLRYKA